MGDSCYMAVNCEKKDVPLFKDVGFYRDEDEKVKGWVSMVDEEANYAHFDEMQKLARGHRFFGFHGEGGNFGAYNFACNGRRYAEIAELHDGGDGGAFTKQGFISEGDRTRFLLYRRIMAELGQITACPPGGSHPWRFTGDAQMKLGGQGQTVAHLAAEVPAQWHELVKAGLVDREVLQTVNDAGWSVAHYAARHGGLACVKHLLTSKLVFGDVSDWSVFGLGIAFGQADALPWELVTLRRLALDTEPGRSLESVIEAEGLWDRVPEAVRVARKLAS